MLSPGQIEKFYLDAPLMIPSQWQLSRKHFRLGLREGRFVKLNRFENRLDARNLKFYCWKLKPYHVYFSVLNWLFPERVGRKYKARYCIPLNGEYMIDVDAHLVRFKHKHKVDDHWFVYEECLDMSKRMTLQLCEVISRYYSQAAIVFSGCAGFHVHILDFDYHDWAPYREKDPVWCHHAARFKFTKLLERQTHVFDRRHFTVSCDPMRVVTVPNTVNGKTGLVCTFIGSPEDLEKLTISEVLEKSKAFSVDGYPEPLESCLKTEPGLPASFHSSTGAMKSCAKNLAGAAG